MIWENRNQCTNKEEAVNLLASHISANHSSLRDTQYDQIEEFASLWEIPFSRTIFAAVTKKFSEKVDDLHDEYQNDVRWNSSACW